ncbi:MAG: RnfABCDGE type electron transport complex subunit B [Candidatus Krumholzibacteriota bacterium]|nr:RnfABCDGE type electron transport complex subunit B [Candidatus Krumholzibacteriota bacterium]
MLTAVIILAALGLAASFGLAMAARLFAVAVDPRVEEVEEALPGVNCGACGYPGCSELAKHIVSGEADITACPVGGETTAHAVAAIMGMEYAGGGTRMVALVNCNGDDQVAGKRFFYNGIYDCESAAMIFGGDKICVYGCLGLGTCAGVCPFDAIEMLPSGLARVIPEKCTGCTKCVAACPKGIIKMVPSGRSLHILCSSHAKGAAAKKACSVACIACQKCVKAAPEGTIYIDNFLAVVNYDREIPPEVAESCPMHTIVVRTVPEEDKQPDHLQVAAGGETG